MEPVPSAKGYGAHRSLAPIVVDFYLAVGEVLFHPAPLSEGVLTGFGQCITRGAFPADLDDPCFESGHYRLTLELAQCQSLGKGQVFRASLPFHIVKQANLLDDLDRKRIQGIELVDVDKFPTDVRHAGNEGNVVSQLIVCGIAIALKLSPEWFEELSGSGFSSPAHLEIEDHRSSRSTVFPQVRLVILSGLFRNLARYRGFVGLKVITGEQVSRLGFNHRHQQLSGGQDGTIESLTTQLDAMVFNQTGTLTVNRGVLLELGSQHFNDELVGKLALGNNLRGGICDRHSLFGLAMGTALLPLDDPHKELRRYASQFLTHFISDDRTGLTASLASAVTGMTGNDFFPTFEMSRESCAAQVAFTKGLGLGETGQGLLLFWNFGFFLNLRGGDEQFLGKQGQLVLGELVGLLTPVADVQ